MKGWARTAAIAAGVCAALVLIPGCGSNEDVTVDATELDDDEAQRAIEKGKEIEKQLLESPPVD